MEQAGKIRLGIVRGISFGVFGPPDNFMPAVRSLGSRFARIYLTWNEVEPQPGAYDWAAVDALLAQVEPGDEIWVTVVSASRWATRVATDFLPASPAKEQAAYRLFVGALVSRCAGKVTHWQCNNEPSNPGQWAGSALDYALQASAFADVVRQVDPAAAIVLGGCGYDVLSAEPDAPARQFFDTALGAARDAFDQLAVHLYDEPKRIPDHIDAARQMMRKHGYEKPVLVGEYGGPTVLGLPRLAPVMHEVMGDAFANGGPALDSAALATAGETPDRLAMRALYDRMADLPPELQMFMQGCPPGLKAKRHRIACREIFTRNLLALSCGVTRTLCWNLAPDVPNYRDRFNLMGFVSDRLALMDFSDGQLKKREPAAEAFRRLADCLVSATEVRRIEAEPGVAAIEVTRTGAPLQVLWLEDDAFGGDDAPPRLIAWPWGKQRAHLVDVFGVARDMTATQGRLNVALGATPIVLSAA